ncbi:probable cinnamyl alcohol dehydrogenase 1 isoform X1 [Euphorbia lathyris]|uniref:probable cinnamyl alcohol dehydrogenase 1 isoform X1 n=1 Tax=Euphorbia lathyris TaxID=212925 RepID=UPI0033142956
MRLRLSRSSTDSHEPIQNHSEFWCIPEATSGSVGGDDVSLKITHCGICYADVIWSRNMHENSKYPMVPGHEIVGIVQEVGSNVSHFKVGDHVGVGMYVSSCGDCEYCNDREEYNCIKVPVLTFNAIDVDGTITKGGYSSFIVVHERFCFKIPEGYPMASAAPLLCAGITVYNPMMRHGMNKPGKSLGVIGLGGLGHMAVKFGKAFGLKVTVISTSMSKKEEAIGLLGADNFVLSSDQEQMKAISKSFDFIVDTSSGDRPFYQYLSLLKGAGILVLIGIPSEFKFSPASFNLSFTFSIDMGMTFSIFIVFSLKYYLILIVVFELNKMFCYYGRLKHKNYH